MFNVILGLIAAAATPVAPAAPATPAATAPAAAPALVSQTLVAPQDKVRCKRYTETGSLARIHKECHTEKEWHQLEADARHNASNLVDASINSSRGSQ